MKRQQLDPDHVWFQLSEKDGHLDLNFTREPHGSRQRVGSLNIAVGIGVDDRLQIDYYESNGKRGFTFSGE